MQRIFRIVVATALVTLFGCDMIVIDRPLGETPADLKTLNLDGVWYVAKKNAEPFFVRLKPDGTLKIAAIEKTDSGFELAEMEWFIGEVGNELYVSGKESDHDSQFQFAKVSEITESKMVFSLPHIEAFVAAIERGEFSGTIDEGEHTTVISTTADAVSEFLTTEGGARIWDNVALIVVRRFRPEITTEVDE